MTRVCDRFSISIEVTLSNAATDRPEGVALYKLWAQTSAGLGLFMRDLEVTHDTADEP